jgi:hypothetical protein
MLVSTDVKTSFSISQSTLRGSWEDGRKPSSFKPLWRQLTFTSVVMSWFSEIELPLKNNMVYLVFD